MAKLRASKSHASRSVLAIRRTEWSKPGTQAERHWDMSQLGKTNLAQAFGRFTDHWSPKIAGDLNGAQVKLVKLAGAFHWHHHAEEDELFLVVAGRLRMGLRDGDVDLEPGEFIIVPHGVEHRPEALSEECHVMLIEPNTTLNTGNVVNARTVRDLDRLA